jgi:hypothetical protein
VVLSPVRVKNRQIGGKGTVWETVTPDAGFHSPRCCRFLTILAAYAEANGVEFDTCSFQLELTHARNVLGQLQTIEIAFRGVRDRVHQIMHDL